MLRSPSHAVLGCHDFDSAIAFFGVLGFGLTHRGALAADTAQALYGTAGPVEEALLLPAGGTERGVLLVTADPGDDVLRVGGYTVDIYTRDIEASVAELVAAGGRPSPIARWDLGGRPFAECRVLGPGGVSAVVIEGPSRRDSLLDADPGRRHSELQATVFLAAATDTEFWPKLGLSLLYSEHLVNPAVATMIGLPDPDTEVGLDLYWDGVGARVELITFAGFDPAPAAEGFTSGMRAAVFGVQDVKAARDLLASAGARVGEPVDSPVRGGACFTAVSPEGIRLEFWTTRP